MTTEILTVEGMSCAHCIKAVTMALQDLPGVTVKDVRLGQATIDAEPTVATPALIAEAIADAGYVLAGSRPA